MDRRHIIYDSPGPSAASARLPHPDSSFTSRIKSLDALKGIAILAIIFLHAIRPEDIHVVAMPWQVLNQICRFAVPCFFLIAGFFFHRSWQRKDSPAALFGLRYTIRILKLFLVWALFYAIVPPFVRGSPNGIGPAISEQLINIVRYPHSFFVSGFVYHLWFLSSLAQAAVVTWACLRMGDLRIALLIGAILYGLALAGGSYSQTGIGFHTDFDMKNGPFVSTLFFALGAWIEQRRPAIALVIGATLLGTGLLMHLGEVFFLHQRYARSIVDNGYLIGTVPYAAGAMFVALAHPNAGGMFAGLGKYSLGLYVLHPYVIEILVRLPLGPLSSKAPLFFSCVILVLTFAAVYLIRKTRFLRSLVM